MNRFRQFAFGLESRQYAGSSANMIAHFHLQTGRRLAQNVGSRAELDQSDALPALQPVADFWMKNDSPRQQPGNLFEDDGLPIFALYSYNILLILLGRGLIHGVEIFAPLVANFAHHSRDRRTVYVHIENIQEDADASPLLPVDRHHGSVGNLTVRGRHQRSRLGRNRSVWVAEKPKKKSRQQ